MNGETLPVSNFRRSAGLVGSLLAIALVLVLGYLTFIFWVTSFTPDAGTLSLAGFAAVVILLTLASLAWNPVHRSSIRIQDRLEGDIPPDHDAVLLQGWMDGDTFAIALTVEGTVQPSRYIVNVVGRSPGPQERPHIYKLEYVLGAEQSYGVPTTREADVLTFLFPLSLLLESAYIVGLEAVIFGPGDPTDFVQEGPREDLGVSSLLPLPFDPAILFGTGGGLAVVLGVLGLRRILTQDRR